jgi:TonB family protein
MNSGNVEVQVTVDETGRVVQAQLRTGIAVDSRFAEAALQAARLWRFEPAHAGEQPIAGERVLRFSRPAYQ